ncbi:MAG TPA: hypothetical protein VK094_00215 [Pseudogracilibacillus sp.]|nr:hypothetical protein [Pseudogracilibacillus sp.]
MSKLEKWLIIIVSICSISLIVAVLILSIENNHLNKENAKYINEIEYLEGSNDLLQEDNQDMQDRIWNWNQQMMKESAE